eukprot:TRINITY_DN11561_c1_g1_i2.p2 TRINITY_DN11561_c1_g1~~TRINITY_DN11561_c1_g1_i2.p2  ORF type:complete len:128 (-),score=27.46 TRINITY_DN11561_c1_g1_i2:802-1185(-)
MQVASHNYLYSSGEFNHADVHNKVDIGDDVLAKLQQVDDQNGIGMHRRRRKRKSVVNPFILFCKEMKVSVRRQWPELTAKQMNTKLAEVWKESTDDVRLSYKMRSREINALRELEAKLASQSDSTGK